MLPNDLYWKEADFRISIVRHCFEKACKEIPTTSDLHRTLTVASDAVAIGIKNDVSLKLQPEMGRALGAIWRLANSLTILSERKVDFGGQLQLMVRGSTDFGAKDLPGKEGYKDFELELNIAAQLIDFSRRPVSLLPPGNSFDISFGEHLLIECKHPSSEKGMARAISECGKALEECEGIGMLVFGMEDVLELAQMPLATTFEEVRVFCQTRLDRVLADREEGWVKNFGVHKRILGIYLVASVPVFLDEGHTASFAMYPLNAIGPSRGSTDMAIESLFRELLVALR